MKNLTIRPAFFLAILILTIFVDNEATSANRQSPPTALKTTAANVQQVKSETEPVQPETLFFVKNPTALKNCRVECRTENNDHIFTSNIINFKNCTIFCTPTGPQALLLEEPRNIFNFNANNISEHFTNLQGNNLNFSHVASERKAHTVLIDEENYLPAGRGDN